MAWRPTRFLLEGELDNTNLGKVSGWMLFAGLKPKVTFDLEGNFHRDIRGATIRFRGDGHEGDQEAAGYMKGFNIRQTGKVGDITAGRPPRDYTSYPYIEWYGNENGRVVIELDSDQIEVVGTPIPICESDPISRNEQAANMAGFLAGLADELQVPAFVVGGDRPIVSDPTFTHWVVADGQIVGEAHSVEPCGDERRFAFVRLFAAPEAAEFGYIEAVNLQPKRI